MLKENDQKAKDGLNRIWSGILTKTHVRVISTGPGCKPQIIPPNERCMDFRELTAQGILRMVVDLTT